jgi:hypothetical protein
MVDGGGCGDRQRGAGIPVGGSNGRRVKRASDAGHRRARKHDIVRETAGNTTFREQTYIRWCCVDPLRPPDKSGTDHLEAVLFNWRSSLGHSNFIVTSHSASGDSPRDFSTSIGRKRESDCAVTSEGRRFKPYRCGVRSCLYSAMWFRLPKLKRRS